MRIEHWFYTMPLRLRSLFRRQRVEEELNEEMQYHLEQKTRQYVAEGMDAEEARRAARRDMDGLDRHKEECRDMRRVNFIEDLLKDIQFGLRQLRRSPGFTAVAVITLALGIGATTAIFSVVNAVLLEPLPYTQPSQLVAVFQSSPQQGVDKDGCSYPIFSAWRSQNRVFSEMAGYQENGFTLTGHGQPAGLTAVVVTPELFTVLGARALLGRTFLPEEGRHGAAPVVLLSESLWRSRFGADPNIIGKAISLDKRSFTVVGVMPAKFRFPIQWVPADVWVPLVQDPLFGNWLTRPGGHWLNVVARLKSGISLSRAQAQMSTISARLVHHFAAEDAGWTVRLVPLHKELTVNAASELLVLLGATGFVLLIACANVANLLVARAISRHREIAVRVALGAGRKRLLRQLLTESALLGLAGGGGGVALAYLGVQALTSLLPPRMPRIHALSLNGGVLLFTLLTSLGASLIFGLAPALNAAGADIETGLKEGGSRAGEGSRQGRLRSILVGSEIALAFVLVFGAGLLIRSFVALSEVDSGFQAENVMSAEIMLPTSQYRSPLQWNAFATQLLEEMNATPGVRDSAEALVLPIADGYINIGFSVDGSPPSAPGTVVSADYDAVSRDYFRVLGITLLRGRAFTAEDVASAPKVAVINEAMARRYFANQDPIGKRITFGFPADQSASREIVGVVSGVRDVALNNPPGPMMYVPFAQAPLWGVRLAVRSTENPASVATLIREKVRRLDKDLPVTEVAPLSSALGASVAEPRFRTCLLGFFGATALALAAQKSDVLRLIVGQGMILALIGVGVGMVGALSLTRFLSSLLYGVKPADPLTFAVVSLALVSVALFACYIPARRATKVDPMVALRHE